MKKLIAFIIAFVICFTMTAQTKEKSEFGKALKRTFKYSTFYGAINGGNSISDVDVFSVTDGLQNSTIITIVCWSNKNQKPPILTLKLRHIDKSEPKKMQNVSKN